MYYLEIKITKVKYYVQTKISFLIQNKIISNVITDTVQLLYIFILVYILYIIIFEYKIIFILYTNHPSSSV